MATTMFGIASLALLFLPRVLAQAVTPINPDESRFGYTYYGCYTDSSTTPSLALQPTTDANMTMDECVEYCAGHGNYAYIGVEYGFSCRCGDTVASTAIYSPDSDCSSTCYGNSSQICGGPNRLSIYVKNGPIRDPGIASSSRSYASASLSSYRSSYYSSKTSYSLYVSSSKLAASLSRDSARSSYTSSKLGVSASRLSSLSIHSAAQYGASITSSLSRSSAYVSQQSAATSRLNANSLLSASKSSVSAANALSVSNSQALAQASITSSRSLAAASQSSSSSAHSSSLSAFYAFKSSSSLSVSLSKASSIAAKSTANSLYSSSRTSAASSLSSYNAFLSSSRSVASASLSSSRSAVLASKASAALALSAAKVTTTTMTTTTRSTTATTTTSPTTSSTAPSTTTPISTTTAYQVTNQAVVNYPAAATLPVAAICPTYDLQVVADNTNGFFEYEVYCDADMGGTDIGYPSGYTGASITTITQCIDMCNAWNTLENGYCQAVVYFGAGQCYGKTDVYKQTDIPAGRGFQYQYYLAGHTAVQLLDASYPAPTATKATTSTSTTTPASTTATTTTTVAAATGAYATYPAAVRNYPAAAFNPNVFCPNYDIDVVADSNFNTYEYQIFCDSDMGGADMDFPTGYSQSNAGSMLACLDICNIINENDGAVVCQAVIYLGPNSCYPKTDIYKQTNTPAGRGHQYQYYLPGHTAAQVLDALYPSPSATKATANDT